MTPKTHGLEPVTVRLAPVNSERGEALSHLAALEHLNRMIAGFASMVSHETRSSLVGIQGWSELIRDGGLSAEEIRSCASDIFDGAQRIEKMIGQMLDLSHLETLQVSMRRRKVDLNSIAAEVVAKHLARQPLPPIALQLDPAIPPVFGDPDRLAQAVDNFVTFARRKFTAASTHHGRGPRACDREGHRRAARRSGFHRALSRRFRRAEPLHPGRPARIKRSREGVPSSLRSGPRRRHLPGPPLAQGAVPTASE